jgi:hypothetical protein
MKDGVRCAQGGGASHEQLSLTLAAKLPLPLNASQPPARPTKHGPRESELTVVRWDVINS